MPITKTLTAAEAEALFEAAEHTRKHCWTNDQSERLKHLNSAVAKLRRAEVLVIEPEEG